jgi:ankyrin repeat protein
MKILKACRAIALFAGFTAVTARAQEPVDLFYKAIRGNDVAALRTLVRSANVNERDKRGATPLLYAAAYGSSEAMRVLVNAGAEVNASNDFGATPLMWAITEPEKVRLLLAHGAEVNARSKMGRTPLWLAAAHDGASATVKMLLDRGADLGVRDDRQSTPLLAATASNDLASVRLLLEKGAGANDKDAVGMTPLMYAASNGNQKAVELLLARGADVNAVSLPGIAGTVKNGPIALGSLTPLLLASTYGGPEIVKTLLDAGANVDAQDVRNMTSLMLAIATDHADPRTVRLLLDRGAAVATKDREGLSAIDWARKFNSPQILRELGAAGDGRKRTPPAERVIIPTRLLGPAQPQHAVAKSIELLQRAGGSFFKEGGCGACHAQNLTAMAVNAAWANHIPVNEQVKAAELKGAQLALSSLEQPLLQRMDAPVPEITIFAMFQLAAENAPGDRTTDAMVHNLVAQQRQAGNWHVGWTARAPMEDGDFSRTAMAIRALQIYGSAGRKQELQKRIERAAGWLAAGSPKTTEDLDMQLLGLKWAGASRRVWQSGIFKLIQQQRADGGWAQTADLPSDAYATGQALYTLHELGVPVTDPAYCRGVRYLLETQQGDGSWHVKSRSPKFQPYFETVFPYGHDQWISASATGWAAMALSYASGPRQIARR